MELNSFAVIVFLTYSHTTASIRENREQKKYDKYQMYYIKTPINVNNFSY